jgi:hypothetical protein
MRIVLAQREDHWSLTASDRVNAHAVQLRVMNASRNGRHNVEWCARKRKGDAWTNCEKLSEVSRVIGVDCAQYIAVLETTWDSLRELVITEGCE